MAVSVAEYLGVSVDAPVTIKPQLVNKEHRPTLPCPFRNGVCDKARRGNKPVCSVRNKEGVLWIVCPHRLCATQPKSSKLTGYQSDVLFQVAQCIYGEHVQKSSVVVKREESIFVTDSSNYSADYVMWLASPKPTERPVVLEMQGGGETTNTGKLTKHVARWEEMEEPTNVFLAKQVTSVGTLETNAWRRQQEQFLIKGNVAMQSGGKMVFCVGNLIYDYLMPRLQQVNLIDLRKANWTLALLPIKEASGAEGAVHGGQYSLPLVIDSERAMFTNYNSFVQALTNQSSPDDSIFSGDFTTLDNRTVTL